MQCVVTKGDSVVHSEYLEILGGGAGEVVERGGGEGVEGGGGEEMPCTGLADTGRNVCILGQKFLEGFILPENNF